MNVVTHLVHVLQSAEQTLTTAFKKEEKDEFYTTSIKLYSIFGDVVVDGLNLAENGIIRIVRDGNFLFPKIYEVRACFFDAHPTYVYESVHFCRCPFFSLRVIFARACSLLKPDRVESAEVMQAILRVINKPIEFDPVYNREEGDKLISASQDNLKESEEHTDNLLDDL